MYDVIQGWITLYIHTVALLIKDESATVLHILLLDISIDCHIVIM